MTNDLNAGRAVFAGLIGTAVMTFIGVYGAPLMGTPPMNPAVMLAGAMGGNMLLGWAGHIMIGVTLAVGYGLTVRFIPGPAVARGALYSLVPYFMAQLLVMPMMGMPLFSGSIPMAVGSLIGHLAYGVSVGAVYGAAHASQTAASAVA